MNDSPHIMAIIEHKLAQVRTQLEHHGFTKAKELLAEIEIYSEGLRTSL